MDNLNLLCCDWGTSNFRLFLVNTKSMEVIEKVQSSNGISIIFDDWIKKGNETRETFYRKFIHKQILNLSKKSGVELSHLPVVLSGMASSSIGIKEIPYRLLPFSLQNPNLEYSIFSETKDFPNSLFVFGGVKTKEDVMRGEEVQLLGLKNIMDIEESVFLLPGTHSKHIWIKNRTVKHFKTYMTGESFNLYLNKSILKNSLEKSDTFDASEQAFFQEGVLDAKNKNLLNALFSVRTNDLLRKMKKGHNQFYLSGLLIGYELKSLLSVSCPIFLAAGNNLAPYYNLALKTLGLIDKLSLISKEEMDFAIPRAQAQLYNSLKKNSNK